LSFQKADQKLKYKHSLKFSCEITAFIAGNCVLCCFNSEFTNKIKKITYKTDKNTNIFVILLVLFVILMILFVISLLIHCCNSLLKQQSTQLPAMKVVISHENFELCSKIKWKTRGFFAIMFIV
jgi:hypothetical protein